MAFTKRQQVGLNECDAKGFLTIKGLARYFQDVAEAHVSSVDQGGNTLTDMGKAWVVCRKYVAINQMPILRDIVILQTWLRKRNGPFIVRDYQLTDNRSQVLAAATAYWTVIDLKTRKLARIDTEMKDGFSLDERRATDRDSLEKLRHPSFSDADFVTKITATPSFIDYTLHVNNTEYLRIISDYLPQNCFNMSNLKIQIDFISETQQNDTLSVYRKQDNNTTWFQISNSNGISVVSKVDVETPFV